MRQQLFSRSICTILSFSIFTAFLTNAFTVKASPVLRLSQSAALGESQSIPTIEVWIGSGINLNFLETEEFIERVWLDDPSKIVVDFDDSNCLNRSDCQATIIHLRRINPLEFPELPQSNFTLLSVITSDAKGKRKLYQFKIAYGQGKPQYYTVTINPEKPQKPAIPGLEPEASIELITGGRATLVDVQRGLSIAKSQGLISQAHGNLELEYRVMDFIALVRNGADPIPASIRAGVSMAAIERLAHLGKKTLFDKLTEMEWE